MPTERQSNGYDWTRFEPGTTEAILEEHATAAQIFGLITREGLGIDIPEMEGGEHQVFLSSKPEHRGRVVKLTKSLGYDAARSGYTARAGYDSFGQPVIRMTSAMPSDYVRRILKTNEVFGDDIKILGVVKDRCGFAFATSQPLRAEKNVDSQEEVHRFMEALGFRRVNSGGISTHCLKESSYYHPEKDVFVSDARPHNFVDFGGGNFMPIDILTQRPTQEMREIITANLMQSQRQHEPLVAALEKLRAAGAPDAERQADELAKKFAQDSPVGELRARQAVKSFMQGKTEAATLRNALAGRDTAPSQGSRGQRHSTTASQRP